MAFTLPSSLIWAFRMASLLSAAFVSSDTASTSRMESLHDFFFLDLCGFLSLTGVLDGVVSASPPLEEETAPRISSTQAALTFAAAYCSTWSMGFCLALDVFTGVVTNGESMTSMISQSLLSSPSMSMGMSSSASSAVRS